MVKLCWASGLLSAALFGGCTRTAEVLSRQLEGNDSTADETDSAVVTQDVATADPSPGSFTSSDTSISSNAGGASDPTSDSSSAPSFEPLVAPSLGVGTAFNTTCAFLNYDDSDSDPVEAVFACFGQDDLEPLTLGELSTARREKVVSIMGGDRHACLLTSSGDVWCWGDNSHGQLGGVADERAESPIRVELPEPMQRLSAGAAHVCAISASQRLYCWGDDSEGQLGRSRPDTDAGAPFSAGGLPQAVDLDPWISVAAGQHHTCGVKSDGSAWCWGRNREGQVSQEPSARFTSPRRVNTDHSWNRVVAGEVHTCALRSDGSLWCWGSDATQDSGFPLGISSTEQPVGPTQIGAERWRSLAARSGHTCAVSQNNAMSCWGRNTRGQLGTGDDELRREPTPVVDAVEDVSVGLDHTCVTTSDLDILCTGSNEFGQLGLPEGDHETRFTSLLAQWGELLALRLVH